MSDWVSLLNGVNNYSLYQGEFGDTIEQMVSAGLLPYWYIQGLTYLGEFAFFVMMALLSSGILVVGFFAFWWWMFVPFSRFLTRNYL